jgi:hypothetical protein
MKKLLFALATTWLVCGCGINTVTEQEIAAIKPGDIVIWRYQKASDENKSWMYADKIEAVDGDKVTFLTSVKESNDKRMDEIREFHEEKLTTTLTEMKKYHVAQPPDEKMIIEIQPSEK